MLSNGLASDSAELMRMRNAKRVRLIKLSGAGAGMPDQYTVAIGNDSSIVTFVAGTLPGSVTDEALIENSDYGTARSVAERLAAALDTHVYEEHIAAQEYLSYIDWSNSESPELLKVSNWLLNRCQGQLIQMQPDSQGMLQPQSNWNLSDPWSDTASSKSSNFLLNPSPFEEPKNLLARLATDPEVLQIDAFRYSSLQETAATCGKSLSENELKHLALTVQAQIKQLEQDFFKQIEDSITAPDNPLGLDTTPHSSTWMAGSEQSIRKVSELRKHPDIFAVIAIYRSTITACLLKAHYPTTQANVDKVIQFISPLLSELFLNCIRLIPAALED
ncbi:MULTISPECIES: hypothetical protein [Trichocoleus]|uniref:Uncharacterized protein n=1 Tax=Trichocoleus desertorum GB2-A4 TaxID=2933944 RepID=A0ABV0JCJ4_9CYAN|nr:hypothetical protein [Trichocoleus sp. FACHB-46]MBD1864159.1 hypothetical protein [Trichocoleus sp. FACHB-46]